MNNTSPWAARDKKMRLSDVKYDHYFGKYAYVDPAKGKIAERMPLSHVGWGRRAVDIQANKTHFDRFENDALGLNEIVKRYGIIEAFEQLKSDILICGVGFLARVNEQVLPFTAQEATGTYDWRLRNIKTGVVVMDPEVRANAVNPYPKSYMEYGPDFIQIYENGELVVSVDARATQMVALTHGATAKKPLGASVLNSAARDAMIDGSRTIRQAMIAAYHYNTKVDVLLGVDNETPVKSTKSESGSILTIGPNDNGQIPQIAELAQHAMAPFNETLVMAARNFCAATKLTLANLAISSDAPQSPEALEIVGDDLRDSISAWHSEMGQQLKQLAVNIYLDEHGISAVDGNLKRQIQETIPTWKPIFRSDITKFGDGLVKVAQYAPQIVKARSLWRNLGLTAEEIDMIVK